MLYLTCAPQPSLHSNRRRMRSMHSEVRECSLASFVIQLLVCKPLERMLFSQDQPLEGEQKEPFWGNIFSGNTEILTFVFAAGQSDTANVLHVTTMENYLWSALINKTKFLKLPEPIWPSLIYEVPNMDLRHAPLSSCYGDHEIRSQKI